jgi:hypothetical protein
MVKLSVVVESAFYLGIVFQPIAGCPFDLTIICPFSEAAVRIVVEIWQEKDR